MDIKDITYKDFQLLFPACSEPMQLEILNYLSLAQCPETIGGVKVQPNLNSISYGQLDDLHDLSGAEDIENDVIKILVGDVDLQQEKVVAIHGYLNMVQREITRINQLFASIKHAYTKEELAAGVEKLSFGSFGILDWYAKRMGIIDQNDVRNVPWIRIYTCMNNDNEQQLYERRLQKQYTKGK